MSIVDSVNYSCRCPNCGTVLKDWQTKHGPCVSTRLEPWEVTAFHTQCNECMALIDAQVDAEVEHVIKRCVISLTTTKKQDV